MSIPALRQPKFIKTIHKEVKIVEKPLPLDSEFVILTLRDENKLVVTSDAYHGILTVENMFNCVFCDTEMESDIGHKEIHKVSSEHLEIMEYFPFKEEFSENLVRQVTKESFYCTICNAIVTSTFLSRHIATEVHMHELERAATRATTYTPF